ncbi:MAG TPA: LysE family translocator [Arachidicoccus soli]|uniref:LysE family translocator n=1 Tax=Arachidicoccus soli TaxID=2341117 RepID=A0A386HS22_9BACT|nr:LysE family translocator [Arachidicoccus soli]AYD48054.1 LysE family translocator [Arachidicoccus soli]HEU0226781.1 LysE family translocator [Arachidicoccus soli]
MLFSSIIKGIAIGLMLSVSVGPVIFAIIKQSINNGHRGGIAFIAGVSMSDIILVSLCNFFTQLFSSTGAFEKIIGFGGSFFLIGLGLYNLFLKKSITKQDEEVIKVKLSKRGIVSIFFSGFLMNTLNPAVILFWIATSASIMVSAKTFPHEIQYRILVFLTCLIFNLCVDISKVFLAGKIRNRLTPHNIHIINRISGVIFIIFGCVLLYGIYTGHVLSH